LSQVFYGDRVDPLTPATPNLKETSMSKHEKLEEKLEQKSPATPDSITKDAELSEEQLKEVSGGFSSAIQGAHFDKVYLHVRKAGGEHVE
jgi:hypothetical protein